MIKYDYIKSNLSIKTILNNVKRILIDTDYLNKYEFNMENNNIINELKDRCNIFLNKYNDNTESLIEEELNSKEVLASLLPPSFTIPHSSSNIGVELEYDYNKILSLEDNISKLVSNLWLHDISNITNFNNGSKFKLIMCMLDDINTEYYYPSILLSDKVISTPLNKNIGYILKLTTNSYIGSSYINIKTTISNKQSYMTLKQLDLYKYINGGTSYNENHCTRFLTPKELETRRTNDDIDKKGKLLTYGNLNKVLLDKKYTIIEGIMIICENNESLLSSYLKIKSISQKQNIKLLCLNKSIYKKLNNIEYDYNIDNLKDNFINEINDLKNKYDIEEVKNILLAYKNDIVYPMNYDDEICKIYVTEIDNILNN